MVKCKANNFFISFNLIFISVSKKYELKKLGGDVQVNDEILKKLAWHNAVNAHRNKIVAKLNDDFAARIASDNPNFDDFDVFNKNSKYLAGIVRDTLPDTVKGLASVTVATRIAANITTSLKLNFREQLHETLAESVKEALPAHLDCTDEDLEPKRLRSFTTIMAKVLFQARSSDFVVGDDDDDDAEASGDNGEDDGDSDNDNDGDNDTITVSTKCTPLYKHKFRSELFALLEQAKQTDDAPLLVALRKRLPPKLMPQRVAPPKAPESLILTGKRERNVKKIVLFFPTKKI